MTLDFRPPKCNESNRPSDYKNESLSSASDLKAANNCDSRRFDNLMKIMIADEEEDQNVVFATKCILTVSA